MKPPDTELIKRVADGDAIAFEMLLEQYREAVRRRLANMVRDDAAAEDLAQETFLRVWMQAGQWQGEGTFASWLFRIATNLALNHLRSARRRRQRPLEIPVDRGDTDEEEHVAPSWMVDASALGPDAIAALAEEQELCQRFVARLPEAKLEVFRLAHEAEMNMREIAKTLDLPEGTVKSRLHYARKRLAREWGDFTAE